jgi:plastocyanin
MIGVCHRRVAVAGVLVFLLLGWVAATTVGDASDPHTAQARPAAQETPDAQPTSVPETETVVHMRGDVFYHDYVFVPPGTTITWVNEEADPTDTHNVLADDGSFASPLVYPGESWSHTFTAPGYYRYVCELHDDMEGAVLVEGE